MFVNPRDSGTVPAWGQSLVILVLVATFAACGERQADYPSRQPPAGVLGEAAHIAHGKALFHDKCATCHGKPSEGRSDRAGFFNPSAPDFSEKHYRHVDPAYLYWRIEVGKTVEPYRSQGSVMPAWAGLPELEIWQLVAYLQSRAE